MSVPPPIAEALLLGTAQDAGVPQIGCVCRTCVAARQDWHQRQFPVSLALIDYQAASSWVIDATPAFPDQLAALHAHAPTCPLAGILLTHAHIGHYPGLMYLGREALNAQAVPVYATPALCAFLSTNGPWSQLVALGNIVLIPIAPGTPFQFSPMLSVTPLAVPHRAEYSDTVAYRVQGATHSLFYCPDIDCWEQWTESLPQFLQTIDIALLDGTFYSSAELPGRNMREIPHPPVIDTVQLIDGTSAAVRFIHLNHSNPLLHPGVERHWLASHSMDIGAAGQRWMLAAGDEDR